MEKGRYMKHIVGSQIGFLFEFWAIILCLTFSSDVKAQNEEILITGTSYEVEEEDVFEIEEDYKVETLTFGEKELGSFTLNGNIDEITSLSGYPAYVSDDTLELHYTYDGSLHSDDPDDWRLCTGVTDHIGDIKLGKDISVGALVIQKSSDGETWKEASDTTFNFLKNEKDNLIVYEIGKKERQAGTFFRVLLAYEIRSRVEENADISIVGMDLPIDVPFINNNEYEYRCCTQVYEFYVCSSENPVILRDVITGEDISTSDSVVKGFQIDKRSSKAEVDVIHDGETFEDVRSYESFYQDGSYTIHVLTPVGREYEYNIEIDGGMQLEKIRPVVFENTKKKGYGETGKVDEKAATGVTSYSTLKLGYGANNTCTSGTYDKLPAYGVTGDSVCFFLSLDRKKKMKENGWVIQSDSWGSGKSEKIYGVSTGKIETGAVIVQTSADGHDWENQEILGYEGGLYNTDFEYNYGDKRDVLIYTPEGRDVVDGIFIRIAYAYLAHDLENDVDNRYLERYQFFLCTNELGAVVIHNLSVEELLEETLSEEEEVQQELYLSSEDMRPGSGTVTGFTIDKDLNPVAEYSVEKDGEVLNLIGGEEFLDTGRYDITLSNFLGSEEQFSIYVDRLSSEEAYDLYFGDAFISGKRIYTEDLIPTFEGGQISYHLNEISDDYLPVGGVIRNTTTQEEIQIESSREERESVIFEPGSYEVTLTNDPFADEEEKSGDYRVYTFRFNVIAEGKAPGPVVNQKNLKAYNSQNISGCMQHAYALIYQSASKGTITLVFASAEAAYKYAASYESGMVEKQKDGSYRYNGSFLVNKKTEYNSNWDVNDAIDYFARLAVQDWFFDMSDEYTYRTMKEQVLQSEENLRTLELDKSIVVFASEEERAALADIDALPIISSMKYAYLKPGKSGDMDRGVNHFEFIHDENGWDSNSVKIVDPNGNEYSINYDEDVDSQLKEVDCSPGIITICEETVYGDAVKYNAAYLPENKNLVTVTLSYYSEGKEKTITLTQKNDGLEVTADSFVITSIVDETDPYSLIKVTNGTNQEAEYYTPETLLNKEWTSYGDYQMKFINRMGYSFNIIIHIENDSDTDISFTGEGTENIKPMSVTFGEHNIQLPTMERYGYIFGGYRDNHGNVYTDEIERILYKGAMVLEAIWTPKTVNILYEKPDGTTYRTDITTFGTIYHLGSYISKNKNEHVNGWLYEGELYTDTITINKEDDYILRASVDEIKHEETDTDSEKSEEVKEKETTRNVPTGNTVDETDEKNSGRFNIWVIIIIAALIALTVAAVKKRLRK